MTQEVREGSLPSSAEVEAELNRELRKRHGWMVLRCILYILATLAVVAVFALTVYVDRGGVL